MSSYPFISLVIPCFNERSRWARLQEGVMAFSACWPGQFELILVDDGSTDGGLMDWENPAAWGEIPFSVKVIKQANTGKGGALKLGVLAASGEFVLTLDADMAALPSELLWWLERRGRFYEKEILIGSREMNDSVVDDSFKRQFVGRVFNRLIRWMTGMPYKDTQCGFKLYPMSVAKLLFEQLQTPGWAHDIELLLRANRMGIAVIQMPIHWKAVAGSKISVLRDSLVMLKELLRIVWMRI
ncbi:MAG: glycosyltransferase [Chitinophagaceae bacterium]